MKNIDTSFLRVSTLKSAVRAGDLLVAEPFLNETWFNRGVISIIDHSDDEGTTGVVLNAPITIPLQEVLDGITREDPVTVYCGGPLSHDRIYFVHTLGPEIIPNARQYASGLWIGGDFEAATDYINEGYPTDGLIRFFIGYSGWTPGQLSDEINEGTWAVLSQTDKMLPLLSGKGDRYWHRAVKALGQHYRPWQIIPQDLSAN